MVAPTDVPPVSDRGRGHGGGGHVPREMTEELVIHGTAAAAFVVVLVGVGHGHLFVDGRRGRGKVVGGLVQLLLFGVRNWMKHHYNIKGCRRGQVFWKARGRTK